MIYTSETINGKFKAKIFALCQLNISKMTWLWFGTTLFGQLVFASIEYVIWGETFPHIFDSIYFVFMAGTYFHYTNELGKFLLNLHLSAIINTEKQQ